MTDRWKDRGWQWRKDRLQEELLVLDVWRKREITRKKTDGTTMVIPLFEGWERRTELFQARQGNRWVVKLRTGKTHGFPTLREAMRMAVFLTRLEMKR